MRPPAPRRGLARCPPPTMTATIGLQQQAGNDSPYRTRQVPAVARPHLRPAQVLVHDSWHPAGSDADVFCPAQWRRQPRRKTRALALVSNSAARHPPPGNPTARWAARSRVAPASAPPDGDDGAPGRERLCPTSGGVDHRPRSRPPWLSTTGIAWGGGEGGATPEGGGDGEGGSRPEVGRRHNAVPTMRSPLHPRHGAGILAEGARELHRKPRTTNKQQSKVDKGWLSMRGSQFCAPTNTPQKDTICHWDWGDLIWRRKKGQGMQLS
jgi:hypothetical protein